MFNTLFSNLRLFATLALIFIGSFGANTLLGIFYNVKILQAAFSKEKLTEGLLKGAVLFAASALLVTVLSFLPTLISDIGLTIPEETLEGISLISMAGIIIFATVKYIKDALQKFSAILYPKVIEEKTTNDETN